MNEVPLTIIVLIVFVGVIYAVERRVKTKGALFTGQPTPLLRVLAVVIGLLFLGLSVSEWLSSATFHFWFPILAVALIGYGLGVGQLLGWLQGGNQPNQIMPEPMRAPTARDESQPQSLLALLLNNRLFRFGLTVTAVLAVLAVVLYGAIWAATHPDNPLALGFVIGIIALVVLGRVFHWAKSLWDLRK